MYVVYNIYWSVIFVMMSPSMQWPFKENIYVHRLDVLIDQHC
jgi:hypothetical protein